MTPEPYLLGYARATASPTTPAPTTTQSTPSIPAAPQLELAVGGPAHALGSAFTSVPASDCAPWGFGVCVGPASACAAGVLARPVE